MIKYLLLTLLLVGCERTPSNEALHGACELRLKQLQSSPKQDYRQLDDTQVECERLEKAAQDDDDDTMLMILLMS